jgi:hypothetical protein
MTDGTSTGEPPIEPWELCPLGWKEGTAVAGTTPVGPFEGNFAGFGESGGECDGHLVIHIVPDAPQLVNELFHAPTLRLFLSGDDWMGSFVGSGPAHFSMMPKGPWGDGIVEVEGEATITEFDPYPWPPDANDWPRIVGDFALQADGWDVAGHFEAELCRNLFLICP